MKIQLKRSNQVEADGSAKQPTAAQMEYGELAVNYNTDDPAIFLENDTGQIVRIAGEGAIGGFSGDYNDLINGLTAGDGINIDASNVVSAVAQAGKGVLVEATGIRIGDDWSNIPALT